MLRPYTAYNAHRVQPALARASIPAGLFLSTSSAPISHPATPRYTKTKLTMATRLHVRVVPPLPSPRALSLDYLNRQDLAFLVSLLSTDDTDDDCEENDAETARPQGEFEPISQTHIPRHLWQRLLMGSEASKVN
ncbi:hypothetical protein BKA70DRAFT_1436190 [Coprinopsis sp. MPI-PUGE-AT-0042]|nr:hypothetical protein BKA70DRAFT_1436190 [Coprinopsis sp. MPI-PUGE-AT-0042]